MNDKIEHYLSNGKVCESDRTEFPLINSFCNYFENIGYISSNNKLTELGEFYFKRASAYGVTVSYLPRFHINMKYFLAILI